MNLGIHNIILLSGYTVAAHALTSKRSQTQVRVHPRPCHHTLLKESWNDCRPSWLCNNDHRVMAH